MRFEAFLEQQLAELETAGLRRFRGDSPAPAGGWVDASSNDYLGYGARPVSRETTARLGSGASRLIFGTHPEHLALEGELATWVGAPDAILFSSGYAANLGLITGLVKPGDVIISDRLNHASIVDGCRLSRAHLRIAPHASLIAVENALREPTTGRQWVIVESYFSMDGDSPDLPRLRSLCDEYGAALVVDEAHALGVFGPQGSGLCRAAGVVPDVLMGGLGKAVGAEGAFVAGSVALIDTLWNRARSLVFSTGTSPLVASLALDRVRAIRVDDAARARLHAVCASFEAALGALRSRLPARRHGPLFPILLGEPDTASNIAAELRRRGFRVQAIRPPTVPAGESRLRVSVHANLSDADLARLAEALVELCPAS